VAVVDRGKVIALGTPAELVASLGGEAIVELAASGPLDDAGLHAVDGVRSARLADDGLSATLTVAELHRALPPLVAHLGARGLALTRLETHRASLEDVFVSLTGRHLQEAHG
jgi:ABC-2 type transport system ATP-binding protein